MELLNARFAIIDIEAIGLGKIRKNGPRKGTDAKRHNCTRKMAMTFWDEDEETIELEPCLAFEELTKKERKSYYWARDYCHSLPYVPTEFEQSGYECQDALMIAMSWMEDHQCTICYYKGGVIESDLLAGEIGLVNLESYGVVKSPINLTYHSPLLEIRDYRQQMVEMTCRDQYNHTTPKYGVENWINMNQSKRI